VVEEAGEVEAAVAVDIGITPINRDGVLIIPNIILKRKDPIARRINRKKPS